MAPPAAVAVLEVKVWLTTRTLQGGPTGSRQSSWLTYKAPVGGNGQGSYQPGEGLLEWDQQVILIGEDRRACLPGVWWITRSAPSPNSDAAATAAGKQQ
jgi:hypothetical protein